MTSPSWEYWTLGSLEQPLHCGVVHYESTIVQHCCNIKAERLLLLLSLYLYVCYIDNIIVQNLL